MPASTKTIPAAMPTHAGVPSVSLNGMTSSPARIGTRPQPKSSNESMTAARGEGYVFKAAHTQRLSAGGTDRSSDGHHAEKAETDDAAALKRLIVVLGRQLNQQPGAGATITHADTTTATRRCVLKIAPS